MTFVPTGRDGDMHITKITTNFTFETRPKPHTKRKRRIERKWAKRGGKHGAKVNAYIHKDGGSIRLQMFSMPPGEDRPVMTMHIENGLVKP